MLKFIYILAEDYGKKVYFKTSHVKVYPTRKDCLLCPLCDFKTSHVKVYRLISDRKGGCNVISKHLMLKFIALKREVAKKRLSNFKTSHVKVYPAFQTPLTCDGCISKHLMLKFIQHISCISYNPLYQISQYLSTF